MNKLNLSQQKSICNLYASGVSSLELARKYNVSKYCILYTLKKYNVSRRTTSESGRDYKLNEQSFADLNNGEANYWAGFIMADGNLFPHKNGAKILQIALASKDKLHLVKLQRFLQTDKPLYPDRSNFRLVVSSSQIFTDLHRYGITPNKSFSAKVSKEYVYNVDFWRGMVDGDGSLFINNRSQFGFNLVGSQDVCEQFVEFIRYHLGITKKVYPHKNIFSVQCVNEEARLITTLLYKNSTIYLDRKYDLWKQYGQCNSK